MQNDMRKLLTTTPPSFTPAQAVHMAATHFGIRAEASPLVSERDQNFRLTTPAGKRFVLKIANPDERPETIDFQNQALLHVAREDPAIPLPRVIPDRDGQLHIYVAQGGNRHIVRVLSWLDGVVINDIARTPGLVGELGRMLARLGLALKGFDHPASNPPILWDMKRAGLLRSLLTHIEDPALGRIAGRTLDRFETRVQPVLETLRAQVIHNDLNLDNVLLDKDDPGQIAGVIDFGDLVKSPLIIDVAVAAAYQLTPGDDPLAGALPLLAGYHGTRPLLEVEMDLLTDLIRTRLITSILINSYRVALFPENREYLMTDYPSSVQFLLALDRLDTRAATRRIRTACGAG